jgi:hypothetical protein
MNAKLKPEKTWAQIQAEIEAKYQPQWDAIMARYEAAKFVTLDDDPEFAAGYEKWIDGKETV